MNNYLRFPELKKLTGLSRTTIWRLEKTGDFPKRRKLSPATVGWLQTEIELWVENRCKA